MASQRPTRGVLSRQGWPGMGLKYRSIFVAYVYVAKLSTVHIDIACVNQPLPSIAPLPQLFYMDIQVVMEAPGLVMAFSPTYTLLH